MRRAPLPIADAPDLEDFAVVLTPAQCIATLTQLTVDLEEARGRERRAVGSGIQVVQARVQNLRRQIDAYLVHLSDVDPEGVRQAL